MITSPSHQTGASWMDYIAEIEKRRKLRLQKEIDDRIVTVQRLLGEDPGARCKHCKQLSSVLGHAEDCALRKINPEIIVKSQLASAIHLRKNANKQRIFKSDKPRWSGMPPGQKTLVRKRTSKNRGPERELRHCRVCGEQTIFLNTTGKWVCNVCQHERPCEFGCKVCNR